MIGFRYLQVFVFEAERAWAGSMELKPIIMNEPRKRFQLEKKIKKAAYHSQILLELSHQIVEMLTPESLLEIQV
jgi:signal recognition particle subunit SRP68